MQLKLPTRFEKEPDFLEKVNKGLSKENFKLSLMRFAANAPEQSPVEDIWLQGKNFIRRNFTDLTSFTKVKKQFFNFLDKNKFDFHKYNWYYFTLYKLKS